MTRAELITTCVSSTSELITPMVERARDITFRTFARRCNWVPVARSLGYLVGRGNALRLSNDWHVSFHKSVFNGKPCYYLRWSGIEYVFQHAQE